MVKFELLPEKASHREISSSPRSSWRTHKSFARLSDVKESAPIEDQLLPKIKSLGERLKSFDCIKRVRITAPKNWDLHWIEFEVETREYTALPEELWDKLQDMVIDVEWQLRDETGENWYFNLSHVSLLTNLESGTRFLWISYLLPTASSKNVQSNFIQFKSAM